MVERVECEPNPYCSLNVKRVQVCVRRGGMHTRVTAESWPPTFVKITSHAES